MRPFHLLPAVQRASPDYYGNRPRRIAAAHKELLKERQMTQEEPGQQQDALAKPVCRDSNAVPPFENLKRRVFFPVRLPVPNGLTFLMPGMITRHSRQRPQRI